MNSLLPLNYYEKQNNNYYIVFSLQDKKYAINIHDVIEVIPISGVEIPQSTPIGITGMFNYKGDVIKSVDLCPFLGLKILPFSINNQFIIMKVDNTVFAVHAENIEAVTDFEQNNIQQIPYLLENSVLTHVYKSINENINIIDSNALLKVISNERKSEVNYMLLFPSDEKSKQILNLRAKHYSKYNNGFSFPVNTQKQYILFIMDGQNYCLDIKYVKEFVALKRLNITKLPYTPYYVTGIVNVKGEFLVVINLKRFLDKNYEGEIKNGKLIITEGKNFNIAFLVEDIKYIKDFNEINNSKIYSGNQYYIYAEYMENNILYNILNFEEIMEDERLYLNIG